MKRIFNTTSVSEKAPCRQEGRLHKHHFEVQLIKWIGAFAIFTLCTFSSVYGQRYMENLGRGTVAVRSSSSQVFVSWRILGLEFNAGVRYNLYRGTTRIATNLNVSNFMDNNSSNSSTYQVAAVVGGVEQAKSPAVRINTYVHGGNAIACATVPIRVTSGYAPKFIWTGDLDGDGELDFVFTKMPTDPARHILLEAYTRTGTFLWQYDCGPNSVNKYNIEPGSSTLDVGHGDNITVYDLNNDGRAEVIVRFASGVRFGDGGTFTYRDNNRQFIGVLNGMTGALLNYKNVPTNYLSDGPMNGHMGIAYLDGVNPSIIWSSKNRIGSGDFNMMVTAYSWRGGNLSLQWTLLRPNGHPDGHSIRCVDVDGDGRDEVFPMGFAIRPDGTILHNLGSRGIVHGDRFQIGKFDPSRAGLQGYTIQQNNESGMAWAYYDARNGTILRSQIRPGVIDYGRGLAGDFDPRYAGWEYWTFTDGMYNISGTRTSSAMPDSYPNMRIFWDGDVLSENLDNFKMTKWDYASSTEGRLLTFRDAMQVGAKVPGLYGDIIGDWREEAVYTSGDLTKLLIFTTTTPTSTRLYTLLHNPAYRLCLTSRGYYQSTMLDIYVGNGMSTPPTPNIRYAAGGVSRASEDNMALVTEPDIQKSVFPNPSRSDFNIKEAGKFNYSIKDQAGNILEQGTGEEEMVAGEKLKPGLYILDVVSEAGTKQIKVIKKN